MLYDCFMQNPFLNGLATLCGLMWYLVLCKDIQKDWSNYKKSKKYQGVYIGDIIVNIITLPLILIKNFWIYNSCNNKRGISFNGG